MCAQPVSAQSPALAAFAGLLRAHACATRRLSSQLQAEHELTLSDYEVLLELASAPERRMRRVDLAGQVSLTASGTTRLLDGLEAAGLVERASCATDRRVVYAVLTDAGLAKLREAGSSHVAQVKELFGARLDESEQLALARLLALLAADGPGSCAADA